MVDVARELRIDLRLAAEGIGLVSMLCPRTLCDSCLMLLRDRGFFREPGCLSSLLNFEVSRFDEFRKLTELLFGRRLCLRLCLPWRRTGVRRACWGCLWRIRSALHLGLGFGELRLQQVHHSVNVRVALASD